MSTISKIFLYQRNDGEDSKFNFAEVDMSKRIVTPVMIIWPAQIPMVLMLARRYDSWIEFWGLKTMIR